MESCDIPGGQVLECRESPRHDQSRKFFSHWMIRFHTDETPSVIAVALRADRTMRELEASLQQFLLLHGRPQPAEEVPTLEQFADRFVDGHARANQQKPSGIATKEAILRVHLKPFLGSKRLDAITTEQVQRVRRHLATRKPKTVNNVLTVQHAAEEGRRVGRDRSHAVRDPTAAGAQTISALS